MHRRHIGSDIARCLTDVGTDVEERCHIGTEMRSPARGALHITGGRGGWGYRHVRPALGRRTFRMLRIATQNNFPDAAPWVENPTHASNRHTKSIFRPHRLGRRASQCYKILHEIGFPTPPTGSGTSQMLQSQTPNLFSDANAALLNAPSTSVPMSFPVKHS